MLIFSPDFCRCGSFDSIAYGGKKTIIYREPVSMTEQECQTAHSTKLYKFGDKTVKLKEGSTHKAIITQGLTSNTGQCWGESFTIGSRSFVNTVEETLVTT
jgi:hypothetical protein